MIIAPDVSYYQAQLDATFNRRVLIMRVTFSPDYTDPRFLANANAAAKLHADGKIDGVILYTVFLTGYTPAQQYAATWKAIGPTVPVWLLGIMIDVEHWGGTSYAITGDHSAAFNQLYGMHAHQMGSWSAVPFYGNEGDLASIIPGRDKRAWGILAAYTGDLHYSRIKGARGQQYTDGQAKYPLPRVLGKRLPASTPPFGACDHNYLDFANGAALRKFMRPAVTPVKPPVMKPPVVVPPVKPAARPFYDTSKRPPGVLGYSPDGEIEFIAGNSGNVEARKHGAHLYYLGRAPK